MADLSPASRPPRPVLAGMPVLDTAELWRKGLWRKGSCRIRDTDAFLRPPHALLRRLVDGAPRQQAVALLRDENPITGEIFYFRCPKCSGTFRKLFHDGDRWLCWECCRGTCVSSRGTRLQRLERREAWMTERIRRLNVGRQKHAAMA